MRNIGEDGREIWHTIAISKTHIVIDDGSIQIQVVFGWYTTLMPMELIGLSIPNNVLALRSLSSTPP
jgi:hypothetical protein